MNAHKIYIIYLPSLFSNDIHSPVGEPLGKVHGFDLTSLLYLGCVGLIRVPKIIMMSSKLRKDSRRSRSNVKVDAAAVPWVELAVEEDDVGGVEEVSSWITTTEEIESPVVHWREPILLLAICSEAILVEIAPVPAGAIGQRHWELTACLNLPSSSVESSI